jgi:hypothetical protein
VVVLFCVSLAALFLIRPPASRLHDRVLRSIGAAMGRSVEVSSVHLRFLPRPGLELENLVIHDDPAFGAEPLLRAPDVTAWLQVTALLRGHIQITTLSFSDASLNLTRNTAGQWNFEDLLQRTSSITVAPTASRDRASRPHFPYIEASGTRMNFKAGTEKTHFALTDAEFALWQESDNAWGMRLRARPIRTDSNLTDTGILNVSGLWQRSAVLHETPVQLSFEWKQAQIGQVSKLVSGNDNGWRGAAEVSGEAEGTPKNLKITADGSVDYFGRQDVLGGNGLRLAVHCSTEYSLATRTLSNLECIAPSGNGTLELKGSAFAGSGSRTPFSNYDLRFLATDVPAQSLLEVVRHVNSHAAGDVLADGRADASLQITRSDARPAHLQGSGELQEFRLRSGNSGASISVGTVPFSVVYGASGVGLRSHGNVIQRAKTGGKTSAASEGQQPHIEIGPFNLSLGRAKPLQVHASVSMSGYEASFRGDAGVKRLLQSARIVGIPAPPVNADGGSTVDLSIAGTWRGDRPKLLGTVQLHSVQAEVRGINGPISIGNANLILDRDEVRVPILSASAADTTWHGSMRIPRPCAAPPDCQFQFSLRTAELSAGALNKYFNPALQKKSWYKFLSFDQDPSRYLLRAVASGKIGVDKLLLGNTTCSNFTSDLRLDEGRITLSGVSGEVLEGVVSGKWEANFNENPPRYRGSGGLDGISLAEVSELMHDGWIDGTGEAHYEFTAAGSNLRSLLDSADLNADFSVSEGIFPHVVLTSESGPLRASTFSGGVRMHEGELLFHDAKLDTAHGVYIVSGTASLAGDLNLKMATEGTPGFLVSGTVIETRVSANPTTAASLKP